MKYRFVFVLWVIFVLSSKIVTAQQSNIIFFSEQGENFSVILNGILQNASPEKNVRITGLPAPSYKLKILFENKAILEIDKNLMLAEDAEMTFCIKKNNKGAYVVRFMNQVAIQQAPPPPATQHVVAFTAVPAVSTTTVIQTQNTTTVNTGMTSGSMNISVGMNVGEVSSTTTTTTTSNATSGTSADEHHMMEGQKPFVMPGYSGPVGCPYPLTDLDFDNVKNSIASKNFEDSKLTIAKQVVSSTCLFASEVKQIMDLFSYESSRVEFAKYAYSFTFDLGNYYKVNSAFKFESSIDELNDFIAHHRD